VARRRPAEAFDPKVGTTRFFLRGSTRRIAIGNPAHGGAPPSRNQKNHCSKPKGRRRKPVLLRSGPPRFFPAMLCPQLAWAIVVFRKPIHDAVDFRLNRSLSIQHSALGRRCAGAQIKRPPDLPQHRIGWQAAALLLYFQGACSRSPFAGDPHVPVPRPPG